MRYRSLKVIEKVLMQQLDNLQQENEELEAQVEEEVRNEASKTYPDIGRNKKLGELTKKALPLTELQKELEMAIEDLQNTEMR